MYRGGSKIRLFLLAWLIIGAPCLLFSQKSKTQLEEEKRENLKKIVETGKILSETQSERKITVGQLNAINQQIKARESLISSINQQIILLNSEINDLTVVVSSLQNDLKNLKEEYAAMIYSTYKSNQGFGIMTFLFSAQTFNQLYMRIKYLEQYAEIRKIQAVQIEEVAYELNFQRENVSVKLEEQRTLLDQQVEENKKLVALKDLKSNVVATLSKKEKELRSEMAEQKKAVERLDRLIAEIIAREIAREKMMSAEAAEDEAAITLSFEQMKNKLIWPVSTGFISMPFGRQPHPVLKGISVDNTGIDIQTNTGAEVKSVHKGVVNTIAFVPGYNKVVIIKHGSYYTVYSRLKDVHVKKDQQVNAADVIGKVQTNAEGISEVHFEIYKEVQRLDPQKWLLK